MKLALKPENLARLVFFIRGEKVMLDADLAALYGVWPKALNQAVKRNKCKISCRFLFSTYGKGMGGFKVRHQRDNCSSSWQSSSSAELVTICHQFHALSRSSPTEATSF